jgi:hypothetical protein
MRLTPYELVAKCQTFQPNRLMLATIHKLPGLDIWGNLRLLRREEIGTGAGND